MNSIHKIQGKKKDVIIFLFLGGMIILGAVIFIFATQLGLGISDDSYYYVFPSQDFLDGFGFHPSSHYPPLLTILLIIPGALGIKLIDAFRWLNAGLFGMNIALAGYLIWYLRRSLVDTVIAAIGLFSLGFFFELHAWAMSEALFLFLTLGAFLSFVVWLNSGRSSWLLLSGLLFGLSTTTRYIGITGLIVCCITVLFFIKPRSFRNLIKLAISGFIPILGMILLSVFQPGGISDRSIGYYPLGIEYLLLGVKAMIVAFLPGRFVAGFEAYWLVITLGCIVVAGWFLLRRKKWVNSSSNQIVAAHVMGIFLYLYGLVYLIILIASRLFLDPLIPFDARLLGPMLVAGVLLICLLVGETWPGMHAAFKWLVSLMIAIVLLVNGIRTLNTIKSYHEQGRGYSSARDHNSETYAYLRKYPDTPIYSNAPSALYFWIGRHTYALPGPEGIAGMKTEIDKHGGFVVLFDSIPLELYHLDREQVTGGLIELIDLSEATIYKGSGIYP
jgi:hypothetical protein